MTTVKNLTNFPFAAIIGQEEMKLALQLNVIDPKIGGVMIMGDRGTGKSTTIRAIADLLPEINVVKDDPFNSHPTDLDLMGNEAKLAISKGEILETDGIKIPMIDLPLGATEDRVCGTIDIEKALTDGVKAFEPGLVRDLNKVYKSIKFGATERGGFKLEPLAQGFKFVGVPYQYVEPKISLRFKAAPLLKSLLMVIFLQT